MSGIPKRGDIVLINFRPQAGREQDKRRPALVLTDASYNRKVGLCVVCPITSAEKGYPFEVPLPEGLSITGVVLADHVKSLDWQARDATIVSSTPLDLVEDVLDRIADLLQM